MTVTATTPPPPAVFADGVDAAADLTEVSAGVDESETVEERFDESQHTVEMMLLPVTDMVIDPDMQRGQEIEHQKKIAADFNPLALNTFVVSIRVDADGNDVHVLLDGQQRRGVCLIVGYTEPVLVRAFRGLTRTQEAQLFRQLNNRKKVSTIDLFRISANGEGNPMDVAIQTLLAELGINFAKFGGFSAVEVARRLAKRPNGLESLRWALTLIHDTYEMAPGARGTIYLGHLVEGFALFKEYTTKFDRYNEAEFLTRLNKVGPTLAMLQGQIAVTKSTRPIRLLTATMVTLVNIYNTDRRAYAGKPSPNLMPDWTGR